MSYTGWAHWASGLTLYAKALPPDDGTWGNGITSGSETGTTGWYSFASLDENTPYSVYVQAGVSPASSDEAVGHFKSREDIASAVNSGSGSHALTVNIHNSDGDDLQGANVSIVGTVLEKTTGTDGQATPFNLDDGTYNVRVQAPSGYVDPSDTSVTINGSDETITITLTSSGSVTPPSDPDLATLTVKCLDKKGAQEADVTIEAKLIEIPDGDTGRAFDGAKQSATSDSNGVATLTVVRKAKYQVKRGTSEQWEVVTIADEATTTITSFVGADE